MSNGKGRGGLGQKKIGTGRHARGFPNNPYVGISHTKCTGSHGRKDSKTFSKSRRTQFCALFCSRAILKVKKEGNQSTFFHIFSRARKPQKKNTQKRHCIQERKSSRLTLFSLAYSGKHLQNQMWETDCSYIKEGTCVTTFWAL